MELPKLRYRLPPIILATSLLGVLVLGGSLQGSRSSAQSTMAQPHCAPVGGTIMTNLGAIDQNTTMGTATGDLRGAVAARILSVTPGANGVLTFQIQHHWVTEAGDTIFFSPVAEVATPLNQGVFGVTLPQPIEVTGGTGRFNGASGAIGAFGSVDLAHGQTVFRYSGQVCFQAPDN